MDHFVTGGDPDAHSRANRRRGTADLPARVAQPLTQDALMIEATLIPPETAGVSRRWQKVFTNALRRRCR
jgi:hypothetical protein